ncbi:nitrate- and nitrite sensing domain-containing protein [Streptomyces sp. TRM 70351]|uniref:sensor histidine kinase n=1 Tax=Streptomyces sp. TRM 70351 TaxID=3116552 RepID=UPI002E7B40AC|nr:nitrate- and nitrite sensing domain-containing protein [Streptomyces sp. TRM 70351]MEE1931561.1 nitrate- and nitrite sensing domain-containing protein [Streptomyces sp. TRM 70351]
MRRRKTASPPPQSRGNFTPPRTAAAPTGTAEPSADPAGSGNSSRFAVRNWRVATRLNAILLIPVLVALLFGGFRVSASVDTLNEAQDAEATARLVQAATAYGHALLDERDRTAEPLLSGDQDAPEVAEARRATDAAQAAFDQAAEEAPKTATLERRMTAVREVESKLGPLRQAAYTEALDGVQTELAYIEVQHPLMNLANELTLGSGNITAYGRTVYAISLSKAAASLTRAVGTHLLVAPGPGDEAKEQQLLAFSSYNYLEKIALTEYRNAGTEEDVQRLTSELRTAQEEGAQAAEEAQAQAEAAGRSFVAPPPLEEMVQRISSGASVETLAGQGVTAESWFQAATAKFDVYRTIEQDLVDRAVEEAGQIAADAGQEAIVNSVIVLAALLIAFVIAALMARTMSKSMHSLRNAAFDVAEQRLPMLVDQLSRTDPGRVDTEVKPIPIDSQDEIGEVARAFDQVHREAVRLAAEQAMLRGNVNAIFTNLSSRNQGLIERQLGLITDLENNEADPDQLESLFKLDHLATRMRRNGENLLVLAGEEPGRRWNQPVPLVDVLRAAASEVEQYERVEISGVPESDIHGSVVTDLVHLLAELLENATSFSSPQTKVKVTATRLPDGRVMTEIHDKGIGLTAEDFADINHKLANPPTVDAAISQRMGLYVVGRLADRHGIRVQLRPSGEQAGTTSLVMLPEAITHGGGGEELVEEDFTVSRIMPEAAGSAAQAAVDSRRTAAELGFDDRRYGSVDIPDDLSALQDGPGGGPQPAGTGGSEPYAAQQYGQEQYGQDQQPGQDQYGQGDPYAAPGGGQPYGTGYDAGQPGGYAEPGHQDAERYDGLPRHEGVPQYDTYDQHGAGYQEETGYRQEDGYGPAGPAAPQGEPAQGGSGGAFGGDGFPQQGHGQEPPGTGAGLPRREKHTGPSDQSSETQETQALPQVPQQPTAQDASWREQQGLPGRDLPRRDVSQPGVPPQGGYGQDGVSATGAGDAPQADGSGWRSANDDRWERAERLRAPQAGGITSSGLPRRVPRANLVEGTAEQSEHPGPQISRAPEDVRGRLSNLHRGVRRGRGAAPGNQRNDRPGQNPGSTYEQER